MRQFEYKVESIKRGTFTSAGKYAEQFETTLNALGAEGWELVEVTGSAFLEGYVFVVFKREFTR